MALLEFFFVLDHSFIEHERSERKECRDKNLEGAHEGPVCLAQDEDQEQTEPHEENAVDPADNLHGERQVERILEGHGDAEEDQEGETFHLGSFAKSGDGIVKHKRR